MLSNWRCHKGIEVCRPLTLSLITMSLDFHNIPGEILPGVNMKELEWLYMLDTVDDSLPQDISVDIDEELNELEQS